MKRCIEIGAAALFAVLQLGLAVSIARSVEGPEALPILALAALLGLLATDFVSGLVHWLCDTFFEEDSPVLGRLLIASFREHHRDPLAITRRGLLEINNSNCLGMIPILVLALHFGPVPRGAPASLLGWGFLFFFGWAVYLTNTFHRWAHAAEPPGIARWLQRVHLAIDPEHHAAHHRRGRGSYCVTTGWLNPALDRWELFPRIERALAPLRRVG